MGAARLRAILMVGATTLVAIASLAGGVMFLAGHGSVDIGGRPMELGVAITLIASSIAIVVGTWMSKRTHRTGNEFVAVGALPVAVCFWWTGIVPAVAIPVAVASVVRSRRKDREVRQESLRLASQ